MKHVKPYKIFESEMYHKISVDEFNDIHDGDQEMPSYEESHLWIDFNDNEIEIVKNIVPDSSRNLYRKDLISLKYPNKIDISIRKFDDEWYSVLTMTLPNEEQSYSGDYTIDDFKTEYYKCDQLDGLSALLNDIFSNKINESSDPERMASDEIQDYFLEFTDKDDHVIVNNSLSQDDLDNMWINRGFPYPIYLSSVPVDKYGVKLISPFDVSKDGLTYLFFTINHPKGRIKGNLDLTGYTTDTIKYYLKKFIRHSRVPINAYTKIITSSPYNDPLSTSIVRIEFLN